MAQVLLPCFLPSWPSVTHKIVAIEGCETVPELIELMCEIHEISNIGLDPEETERPLSQSSSVGNGNEHLFEELQIFLTDDCSADERQHFVEVTIREIARLAVSLKELRPANGLKFSLQQQSTCTEMNRSFVAALIANAFLSTFPNRNINTHPTLQNFNFTNFFKSLKDSPLQKAKLRSLLHYFDWISGRVVGAKQEQDSIIPPLRISRKVMTGKQWLTIDDWNECTTPLAPVDIRHDMKIDSSPVDVMQIIFVSPRIGGEMLGPEPIASRESVQFAMCPELMVSLLFVEALEDNENLLVENCYQFSRILAPKQKAIYEKLESPRLLTFGCMDAECYSHLVVDQFEEDNFLRELNKCLLTFLPNMNEFTSVQDYMIDRRARRVPEAVPVARRLSPIGERSISQGQKIFVKGASDTTPGTGTGGSVDTDSELVIEARPSWLSVREVGVVSTKSVPLNAASTTKAGKFIVLGSSGECLPVNRPAKEKSLAPDSCDTSSSMSDESSEEFHSAKESVEDADEEDLSFADKYLNKLYSPEKRFDFARRLREALCEHSTESMLTDSTDDDDSYGVGAISIKGPDVHDLDRIRIKRRGSDGFVLQEDSSFDEDVLQELILQGCGGDAAAAGGGAHGNSSKYSFSTDMSSELSEFCNLSTDEQQISISEMEMDMRNKAVFHFATSILKRGLSESTVGCGEFPASENDNNIFPASNCDVNNNDQGIGNDKRGNAEQMQNAYNSVRSLSVVDRVNQKHLLASKLITDILQKRTRGGEKVRRIATGNWGCGRTAAGDVQLKFLIQWMAATLSGIKMIYHTAGNEKLSRLDTLCRILRDRKWSVGRLARCTMKSNQYFLDNPQFNDDKDFFYRLLGIDRSK